jgi:hypothetical protein
MQHERLHCKSFLLILKKGKNVSKKGKRNCTSQEQKKTRRGSLNREKRISFFFPKSKSLKFGFLVKGVFLNDKRGTSSVKDEVISLVISGADPV